jgi:hypothetical protein
MIRLADLPVEWQNENPSFTEKFICEDAEAVARVDFSDKLSECYSVQYTDFSTAHVLRSNSGDIVLANSDWTDIRSYCLPSTDTDYALALAALCSRFSYFDTILSHSSFIEWQGKGVIFTGYSGAGKTTQAELWAKYADARIVNGDKTFIREIDGSFYAYGLPWKGSSAYCLNEKAPLCGIVVVRQSAENRISRLDKNAAEYFMPHIFLPHWDEACLDNALCTFDRLIKNVPVWLIECRPDEEAVKITRDAIFG